MKFRYRQEKTDQFITLQRFLFSFVLFGLLIQPAFCQDKLWGTVPYGGQGTGVVYSFNADGSGFEVVKMLETEGSNPGTHLLYRADGFLYGVLYGMGLNRSGMSIFKIKADGTGFAVIHSFNSELPNGGLVELNGFLYGTTADGGISNFGTIYRIRPDGSDFTTLYEFTGMSSANTGYSPRGGLLIASDGHIYGTAEGGQNGNGTIFKINKDTQAFTSYPIPSWGRDSPNGHLIERSDGFLYGTATEGVGAIFKVRKDGTGYTVLKTFDDFSKGQNLRGGLTEAPDGALIGTFNYGGAHGIGGVYRINADGTGYTILHSFQPIDGNGPSGELILSPDGFIYGTTVTGGVNNYGTVYKIKADGSQFTKLIDFDKVNGRNHVSLTLHDGVFYYSGQGGLSIFGVIGILDEATGTPKAIKDFNPPEGGIPSGRLLYHSDGHVYGIASVGGQYGKGTLFRIDPATSDFEVVAHFKENILNGDLVEKANGKILGIVKSPSIDPASHIFEYDINTGAYQLVYKLEQQYISNIWESYDGEIIGNAAPTRGDGQWFFFKLDSTYSNFAKLDGLNSGSSAWTNHEQDTSMMMYGTHHTSSNTRISSYNYSTGDVKNLHVFDSWNTINGAGSTGPLTVLGNEKIVGVTQAGGAHGKGVMYSMKTDGTGFTRLHDFNVPDSEPTDGVTRVTDDLFYGVLHSTKGGAVYRYETLLGFSIVNYFEDFKGYLATVGLTRAILNVPRIQFYGDLKFGGIEIYQSLEKEIKIKNVGTGDLVIDNLNVPEGFTILGQKTFTISPGQLKTIKVRFDPIKTRRYAGRLIVDSNAPENNSMAITGNGTLITGIEDISDTFVTVYPNPTNHKMIVETTASIESLVLINSVGKIMLETKGTRQHDELSLANLPSGVYLLLIETSLGNVKKRVVKY